MQFISVGLMKLHSHTLCLVITSPFLFFVELWCLGRLVNQNGRYYSSSLRLYSMVTRCIYIRWDSINACAIRYNHVSVLCKALLLGRCVNLFPSIEASNVMTRREYIYSCKSKLYTAYTNLLISYNIFVIRLPMYICDAKSFCPR